MRKVRRVLVALSKPSWAQSNTKSAARAASEQLQFRVYLHGVDEAGAESTATDTVTGYDNVTGLGTPNGLAFLSAI